MLKLIGLGLYDEKDISLKGFEEAKNSDVIYCEVYTSPWKGNLKSLEKMLEKRIILVDRKFLEDNVSQMIKIAKIKNVCLLVPGDPLVATTHSSIVEEVKKKGVKVMIIHSSSIVSAIAETGLQIYKFGRIVTIPFPSKMGGNLPYSVYSFIKENKKIGLHTLCLLDIEGKRYMNPKEAAEILIKMENEFKEGVISPKEKIVVACELGSLNPTISYISLEEVTKRSWKDPAVIIILGKLHFSEKEKLEGS